MSPSHAILSAGFGLAYILFLRTEQARLAKQRQLIQHVRNWLARELGLVNLKQSGEGWDDEAGYKLVIYVWTFTLLVSAATLMYEGNLAYAFNMCSIALASALGLVSCKSSKRAVVTACRITFFFQVIVLCALGLEMSGTTLRRTIVTRVVGMILFIESLEEALVGLLLTTITLHKRNLEYSDLDQGLIFFPLQVFCLGVVPMHVLGITEWILASARKQDAFTIKFVRDARFLSCLLPLYMVFSAYLHVPADFFAVIMGIAFLGMGVLLRSHKGFGTSVNRWVAPHTFAFRHHLQQQSNKNDFARYAVCFITAFSPACCSSGQYTAFVFLISGGLLLILSGCNARTYSQVQSKLLLFLGVAQVCAYQDAWASFTLVFLGMASFFICLLMTCAKEVVYARLARDHAADNFVAHAVQQKFAAVGAAVEQALRVSNAVPLLQTVLQECKLGHARCHASTIFRKLGQGEKRASEKRRFENVCDQLSQHPDIICSNRVTMETDWEILHLVLAELTRKRRKMVEVYYPDDREDILCFRLDGPVRQVNIVLQSLLDELGAKFVGEEVLEISARLEIIETSNVARARLAVQKPSHCVVAVGGQHQVLSSLRFALLDDNALIRKNFERLLKHNLGVPEDRIYTAGATLEESEAFAQRICDMNVDIAIFDQNLDFDGDRYLKGSELARHAKLELGYKGCLILHSSDANLAKLIEDVQVFHGGIEKTAHANKFVQGMLDAWQQGFKNI